MKRKILTIILILFLILSNNIAYAADEETDNIQIYSDAAILMDSNTGYILYQKNAYEKKYPASTTKILTAILAIENCSLNDNVTVTKSAISAIPAGYSSANLVEGEILSVYELLLCFLVHSANDAGYVLAEHISGSIEEFANLMNEKASSLGCSNTHFTNPSGIHDEDHYTTAYDLSLIAKYCMKNSTFRNIVSMETCTIEATSSSSKRTYSNTNSLIIPSSKYYLSDCIGIKTGYTSEAKNCLISCCLKDDLELISVVLGSSSTPNDESARYVDSIELFNYGYSNYSLKTIAKKGDILDTIQIANGNKETRNLDLVLEDDVVALVKNSDNLPDGTIILNEKATAPIAKGTVVATIQYEINGISYSQNLLASCDVEKDDFLLQIFKIALIIIILLILFTMIFSKSKKKRKKKSKYYRNN